MWRSEDGGDSFALCRGLWDHPHRSEWGAGYGGAAAHSVVPGPDGTVHVAMSTGGVYRTTDGGGSWRPRNAGISTYFLPGPAPEFGQCVHKIARDAEDPRRLYAQNHHGVYRSDDDGDSWTSIADGLPSDFGFVMLAHPRRGGTVWVVPLVADGERIPPGGRLAVHRSDDAGQTWTELSLGCPTSSTTGAAGRGRRSTPATRWACTSGTRGGEVYASADEGESFRTVAGHLPDVLCVRAAVLPRRTVQVLGCRGCSPTARAAGRRCRWSCPRRARCRTARRPGRRAPGVRPAGARRDRGAAPARERLRRR